jgi:glycosyltransferase involved in cell wall biosynthesis
MRKVKLLYVITKLELGGAQKQLLFLLRHLNRERFQVFLFTGTEGLLKEEAFSIPDLSIVTSRFLERPIHPIKDFLAFLQLYWVMRRKRIEIVHTHSSKAGILGRFAAVCAGVTSIIHTVHGWSFNDYQGNIQRKLFVWLERLCSRFTSRIIVVSRFDKNTGLQAKIGQANRYELIRYGIDFAEWNSLQASEKKEALRIEEGELVVGMVACLKPQKAPLDFIRLAALVLREFSGVRFILIGDGALRSQVEEVIRQHHLERQVLLCGWRRDIPQVLSLCDIFVLTSLWEGMPIAVIEAMYSSLSVVVSDTGGVGELVRSGENGFLVPVHDMQSMAKTVIALLRSREKRLDVGRKAKETITQEQAYRYETMLQDTQKLYESLLKGTGNAFSN